MADAEQAFHQQVAQKIWNQVMECNVFLRNERFPKEIFETLYREYGGRLAKTVGEGTGETCSGCGRANTWHPECPICHQLTKLEAKLAKALEATKKIAYETDEHSWEYIAKTAVRIAIELLKEIDNE